MIGLKRILKCDYCCEIIGEEDDHPNCVSTGKYNGGEFSYTAIKYGGKEFWVGCQHYCNIDCLVKAIKKELGL